MRVKRTGSQPVTRLEIRKVRVKRTGSQRTNAYGDKEGAGKAHGLAADKRLW